MNTILKRKLRAMLQPILPQRGYPISNLGARVCELYLRVYKNVNVDFRTNGERRLLEKLGSLTPRIILDVGANHGEWALAAAESCSESTIHCFEISPGTFEKLMQSTSHSASIHCHPFGLLDREGEVAIFEHEGRDALTSTIEGKDQAIFGSKPKRMSGAVRKGDEIIGELNIDKVDLLKIDVEGADYQVLEGFSEALESNTVRIIQFEYGLSSVYTKFLLRDYYQMLEEYGYVLGKLYPNGVNFKSFDPRDEDFLGPNYVACRKSEESIIAALSRF